MSLQIIAADLRSNRKEVLLDHLLKIKESDPQARIFYIVPEHIKFDMEAYLLTYLQKIQGSSDSAMFDIQVASFSRLAWFLLPANLQQGASISKVGLMMLLKQSLGLAQEKLRIYRGQVNKLGFIEKLFDLFEELYQACLTPQEFLEIASDDLTFSSDESARLLELAEIYQIFDQLIGERNLLNYQIYQSLSEYLEDLPYQEHLYLLIDHYYYFSAEEMNLLISLVKKIKKVFIYLPLTREILASDEWQPLFNLPKNSFQQIQQLFSYLGADIDPIHFLQDENSDLKEDLVKSAAYLKRYLNQEQIIQRPAQGSTCHELWQCSTPQEELLHLSNQIYHLVKQKGYRYRDILVLTKDLNRYQTIVAPYFSMNDIPYFYDHSMKMKDHPLLQWLNAAFNLYRYYWSYEDLILLIKNPLFKAPIFLGEGREDANEVNHQLSLFENIILAHGYTQARFSHQSFQWNFPDRDLPYVKYNGEKTQKSLGDLADHYRTYLLNHYQKTFKLWQQKKTARALLTSFYQFLLELRIPEKLKSMTKEAILEGQLAQSRQHEQVWSNLMTILDEFVDLYGDSPLDFEDFSDLLLTGLTQASFHIIPPNIDQVTFASIESPQVSSYKIVFIIGADQDTLFSKQEMDSLLTRHNRQVFAEKLNKQKYIQDREKIANQQDSLFLYQSFLLASEYIYISYASNVDDHPANLAAPIESLAKTFAYPSFQFSWARNPLEIAENYHPADLGRPKSLEAPALQVLSKYYYQLIPMEAWKLQRLSFLIDYWQNKMPGPSLKNLCQAVFNFNQLPKNISPDTALQLYGKNFSASVSRIEQFYRDPYSYFLNYGLKIQKRERYELDPRGRGNYFHLFLEKYGQAIIQSQRLNKTPDPQEIYQAVLKELNLDPQFAIYNLDSRYQMIKEDMLKRIRRFIQLSHRQQTFTHFQIQATEALFGGGSNSHLKALEFPPLKSGGQIFLRGKIDRIDAIKGPSGENYLQVIDYKSGQKSFSLKDVYEGLDLQILTYLAVALVNHPQSLPLGAFYQSLIQSPIEVDNKSQYLKLIEADQADLQRMQKQRLDGFVTLDQAKLTSIDQSIEDQGGSSAVYPVNITKSKPHRYDSNSQLYSYTEEEFKFLLDYSQFLIYQAAETIQSGYIALAPFKDLINTTLSLQGDYRVITGFDASEHYEAYHEKALSGRLKKEDIFQAMKEKLMEKGGTGYDI